MANIKHELMVDIEAMLAEADPPRTGRCSICRVPCEIRSLNDPAYTPKVVSIGPLHCLDPNLRGMKSYKMANFKKFVDRASSLLEDLVSWVESIEREVRLCYAETLNLSKKELCKVILIDASFIIELFLTFYYKETDTSNDALLFTPWLASDVRLDLLLFENQLPFFAIEGLFDLVPGTGNFPSFIALTYDYFGCYNTQKLKPDKMMHFTDLLRTFHLGSQISESSKGSGNETVEHLPSATELGAAGIRFELNAAGIRFELNESPCLPHLEFSDGVLKIPQLKVDDSTETLFRNMMALEQSQYPYESYITDFVAFMNFLINTREDVDLLVRKKIVCNWSGDSNAVADLFKGLWKNVTYAGFTHHYYCLCEKLNAFYRHPFNNRIASLRRNYWKTPWMKFAIIAAIVIVTLTIIEAAFSIVTATDAGAT